MYLQVQERMYEQVYYCRHKNIFTPLSTWESYILERRTFWPTCFYTYANIISNRHTRIIYDQKFFSNFMQTRQLYICFFQRQILLREMSIVLITCRIVQFFSSHRRKFSFIVSKRFLMFVPSSYICYLRGDTFYYFCDSFCF